MALIDKGQRTSVIILRLSVVNLKSGGGRQPKGRRPSEVERSHGRRSAWFPSLGKSWVLVTSIARIIIVIGVERIVVVTAD